MFDTLSYQFTVLYRDFFAYTSHRLQQLGLSYGVLFLLIYIGKHPGCSQGELTTALGLDWGYCQRSLLKLVSDGFLTREKRGRAYHLNLSEKGQEAFQISHQVFFDWDELALKDLSSDEKEELRTILKKIKKGRFSSDELPDHPQSH